MGLQDALLFTCRLQPGAGDLLGTPRRLSLEEIRELLDDYDRADRGRRQLDKALDKLHDKATWLESSTHIAAEIDRLEARRARDGRGRGAAVNAA